MNRLFPVSKFLAGFLVFAVLATPTASFADLIPTEELFKPSEFHNVRMSPDGLYVAAIARTPAQPDGQNLIVMNLSDRSVKVLTGYPEDEVTRFWWVTDQRLVFMLNRDFESRAKTADYLGTYAIDRDGSHGRRIHVPFEGDSRGGRGLGGSAGSGTGRIGGIREDFQVLFDDTTIAVEKEAFGNARWHATAVRKGKYRDNTVPRLSILDDFDVESCQGRRNILPELADRK